MVAAQAGDEKAYNKLLTTIYPLIVNFIKKRIYDKNVVEDIAQEVLLGMHKKRHTYDPSLPFEHWLFAIIRYKTVDAIRTISNKKAKEFELDSLEDETFVSATPNPITKVTTMLDLNIALASLSQKQKEVIVLTKIKGYSAKEVAEKTGFSVSDVKITSHRTLKKLQQKFKL